MNKQRMAAYKSGAQSARNGQVGEEFCPYAEGTETRRVWMKAQTDVANETRFTVVKLDGNGNCDWDEEWFDTIEEARAYAKSCADSWWPIWQIEDGRENVIEQG